MKQAVEWFARNSVAANLLMFGIVAAGALTLIFNMKVEIFPDTQLDTVNISVPYPGAAPEEVEKGISLVIEEAIADLPGIKQIIATAEEGRGSVAVEVEPGYNPRELLGDIKVRVDAIDTFPEDAESPVVEELTLRTQVLSVAVAGDADEATLRVIADRVKDEIKQLPGITQVSLSGVRPYEIAIEISEGSLRRYGLTFDDVANAVRQSSLDLPGGSLKTSSGEVLLRTPGQAYRQREFEEITVITNFDGSIIKLKDVATVIDGFEETALFSNFDGERAAVVNVYRVGDQNALRIANQVHKYVKEAQKRAPDGISLKIWKDDSQFLRDRISTLVWNALQGLALVFLCLALFLRLNLAFWVTLGIPVSFLGAFAVMYGLDVSINMISLFALILVLGIVVDDAIVVGENVYTHAEKYGSGIKSAISGTNEVAIPVTFAVLTSMAAFLPMLNIPGVAGKIWGVIPLTVLPCLAFSIIESKFVLPAHLSHIKTKPTNDGMTGITGIWRRIRRAFSGGLDRFVRRLYRPFLFIATKYRYVTVLAFCMIFAVTISLPAAGWLKFVFFPQVPADFIIARLEMPLGTPIEKTQEAIEKIRLAAEEVRKEIDHDRIGGSNIAHVLATVGDQPFQGAFDFRVPTAQSHLGEVTIELIGTDGRSEGISSSLVERRWREITGTIPGAVDLGFKSTLASAEAVFDFQLMGRDFDQLRQAAIDLKSKMSSYEGVIDITDSFRGGKKEIKLDIQPSAEALGLTRGELGRQVRQAFYGEEAQRIQRGKDEVKVMVRYPYDERRSLSDLENFRVRTPSGEEVPFSAVADSNMSRAFSTIKRVDFQRSVNVTGEFDSSATTTSSGTITEEISEIYMPELTQKYPGVQTALEGESRERSETLQGLASGGVMAALLIYALMAIPFRSYVQPIIIMSVIPFSLIGAIWGHIIMGMTLSMLSICGMIALAGVVINDGLVLVNYINERRREGIPLGQAVRRAGVARFRAILLTSLTTFAGLMPLLSETSTQAQFLKPMANSLAFGVMFATMLNLILVPCIYLILEDIQQFIMRTFTRPVLEAAPVTASGVSGSVPVITESQSSNFQQLPMDSQETVSSVEESSRSSQEEEESSVPLSPTLEPPSGPRPPKGLTLPRGP